MDFEGKLADSLIKRGVIFLSGEFKNVDHDKFFIIMGEDEENYIGFFYINSNIYPKTFLNQSHLDMQMPIKCSNYDFLEYNSFIGGHKLLNISKKTLKEYIENNKAVYKGELNSEDMELLLEACRKSKLFSEKEKQIFN